MRSRRRGGARGHEVPVAAAAVDDVLPHQHPEPVAVGVPPQRLDLGVLAQHREAERLHRLDVVDHRRVARWCEQPVGPVALVEDADVHDRLAVEQQPGPAVRVGAHPERAQPGVGGHPVLAEGHLEVVEVRVVGGPRPHLGERDQHGLPGHGRPRPTTVEPVETTSAAASRPNPGRDHRHLERADVQVRHDHQPLDVRRAGPARARPSARCPTGRCTRSCRGRAAACRGRAPRSRTGRGRAPRAARRRSAQRRR